MKHVAVFDTYTQKMIKEPSIVTEFGIVFFLRALDGSLMCMADKPQSVDIDGHRLMDHLLPDWIARYQLLEVEDTRLRPRQ
jgi:hypothetical protein